MNTFYNNKLISKNEWIIEKAVQYKSKKGLEKKILLLLNQMCLHKWLYLLYKLIGMKENCKTKEFRKKYEWSYIKYLF